MKLVSLLIAAAFCISASQCQEKKADKKVLQKIEFDYASISDEGLINSEVSVDYEFCIPKDDAKVAEIKSIEPDVKMPSMAKGRIGCSKEEWLCIVNTSGPEWKEKLYAIASLPYVKKIVQTYYE